MVGDRLSPADFAVGQHQQCAQQHGGVSGVRAQLGEDVPVLEIGEGVLDGARSLPMSWPVSGRW
jgi:hypothetical protein